MNKEELIFQKRIIELSKQAFHKNIVLFTDFLNLNELNILHTTPKNQFFVNYKIFGGYGFSERQMVSFIPDAFSCEVNYPISILKIEPLSVKFSEQLTHRDYLGAILNLGIERCKIGDILVKKKETLVFVSESMASFITMELIRIKHTAIKISRVHSNDFTFTPQYEEIKGSIASVRLDSILSLVFSSSRSKLVALIEDGSVFVNGKLITTNSYQINDDDIVSVRGLGKFSFKGVTSTTKKGRYYVAINKYI